MVISLMLQTMKRRHRSVRRSWQPTAMHAALHRKQLVRHVDRCTTLPTLDRELARCTACTLGIAMGRIVHLHRHLEDKWIKLPAPCAPGAGGHIDHCIYQYGGVIPIDSRGQPRGFVPDVGSPFRAHLRHAEAHEHALRSEGPEFSLQTLWRAFRMAIEYLYWEPYAHARNLERRNRYFRWVLQGEVKASQWSICEMPILSGLGHSLLLVALNLENDMHGQEHSFFWDLRRATQYIGEWFPRATAADGTEVVVPRSLGKEMGWFANTLDYDFGAHDADPMGLLHEFLVSYHEMRRSRGLARARAAFAALSVDLQREYGLRRWYELHGEPPTSGEYAYLVPLGRGLFEMQWEAYVDLRALREPDWYILESLCASLLLPPSDLFDTLQAGTFKKENMRSHLEGVRSFICHTLYEPTQTLERMADYLENDKLRLAAMARLVASGVPEARVLAGCTTARLALEAWRRSVGQGLRERQPPNLPLRATTAASASPLDTVDRLACALPEPSRVACAQEATPPDVAPRVPHPVRDAGVSKRRALSMLVCPPAR